MSESAIQQKIIQIARRYGRDPSDLSPTEYAKFSLMARETFAEKVSAAGAAAASAVRTSVGFRVAEVKASQNEQTCRNCPTKQFRILEGGTPACDACGCSGWLLRSKWLDPMMECPHHHWTNKAEQPLPLQ